MELATALEELNKAKAMIEIVTDDRNQYADRYNQANAENTRLQRALDAEREKVKELEANQAEYEKCTDEQIIALNQGCLDYEKQLSQLQALVRAVPVLPSDHVVVEAFLGRWAVYATKETMGIFFTQEHAKAYADLLKYRRTLAATTPATTKT